MALIVFAILVTLLPSGALADQATDTLGDPLPERAVARLGSSRLRHGGEIDKITFSPDGTMLASWGGRFGVSEGLVVWDAATGRELHRFTRPRAWLETWAWSPDGRFTAVLKSPEKLRSLFDFNTAKVDGQPFPEADNTDDRRFALSPAGNMVAVARFGSDGIGYRVEFRELSPNRPARDFRVMRTAESTLRLTTILQFTPNGQTLIAITPERNPPEDFHWIAVIWDVATATERRRLTLPETAFSPPGRSLDASNDRLAVGFPDGRVSLYDFGTGKEEELPERHEPENPADPVRSGTVAAVRFTRDGKTLVTAGTDHVVRIWTVASRKKILEFRSRKTYTTVMDVSPDGTSLAVGGRVGIVRLFKMSTGAEVCPQPGHERGVLSMAVSDDNRLAATAGLDSTIRIWDVEKSQQSRAFNCDGFVKDCALAPDSKTLLAGVNRDDDPARATLHLWNAVSGEELRTPQLTGQPAESARFTPAGKTLITLSCDTIAVWSWPHVEPLRQIKLPQGDVRGFRTLGTLLGVAPDADLLVTMNRHVNLWRGKAIDAAGGSVDLWDTKSGTHVAKLKGSDGFTERAAFTTKGELLVAGVAPRGANESSTSPRGGAIHVFDARTGRLKRTFEMPSLATALAVSPDGDFVYLGNIQGAIDVCEISTCAVRSSMAGHHDQITALTLTANGRRLVSTSLDCSALIWNVAGALPRPAIGP